MNKILVIEADSFLSKFYTNKIQKLGYEVDAVMNGEEALQNLKTKKYDGLLMELILPYRDGFTLLQDIKKLKKRITAIVVASELQQPENIQQAFDLGIDLYYIKGESQIYDIIDALQALIEKKTLPADKGVSRPKDLPKKPATEVDVLPEETESMKKAQGPTVKKEKTGYGNCKNREYLV